MVNYLNIQSKRVAFSECRGYHVLLTHGRSPVREHVNFPINKKHQVIFVYVLHGYVYIPNTEAKTFAF